MTDLKNRCQLQSEISFTMPVGWRKNRRGRKLGRASWIPNVRVAETEFQPCHGLPSIVSTLFWKIGDQMVCG